MRPSEASVRRDRSPNNQREERRRSGADGALTPGRAAGKKWAKRHNVIEVIEVTNDD